MPLWVFIFLYSCISVSIEKDKTCVQAGMPPEPERAEQWYESGFKWPPNWKEESTIKKQRMAAREAEIQKIPHSEERLENYLQYTQSRFVPTFTDLGFMLRETPAYIQEKLYKATMAGVNNWDNLRSEGKIDVIFNQPSREAKFVDLGKDYLILHQNVCMNITITITITINIKGRLAQEVMHELTPLHEEWTGGIKLQGTSAYGVRLYQNDSTLVMHYDRVATHVISSIVHIAHEYDNDDEPWPIQIEDHDGNLHSIALKPGQMLHYESASCLHGRMTKLKGKYYGSIFLHYAPVDKRYWNVTHEDGKFFLFFIFTYIYVVF